MKLTIAGATIVHVSIGRDELPDAGEGMCCAGAASRGPGACTCWITVHDLVQSDALEHGPMAPAETSCHDCAFRPGSPEACGDKRFAHSEAGDLDQLLYSDAPFLCHQGMRRVLGQMHPAGDVVESGPGAYDPPIAPPLSWRADGQPALVCAGWLAKRLKAQRDRIAHLLRWEANLKSARVEPQRVIDVKLKLIEAARGPRESYAHSADVACYQDDVAIIDLKLEGISNELARLPPWMIEEVSASM